MHVVYGNLKVVLTLFIYSIYKLTSEQKYLFFFKIFYSKALQSLTWNLNAKQQTWYEIQMMIALKYVMIMKPQTFQIKITLSLQKVLAILYKLLLPT